MPRILEDPTRAICPSFEGEEWEVLKQPMIDMHAGDIPLTMEQATQRMRDAWTRQNERKIAAWNEQAERDRMEQEEHDREAQEQEDVRQAQRDREAEEQRSEAEKRKPKLNPFNRKRLAPECIEARPSQYAINKVNNLEYIELDYFTIRGCKDASADTNKSISHDTLAFTQLEDTFAIRPMAALRPSKNIRNDEDLSWDEMWDAKNTWLHFMALSGAWPDEHAESLAAFFVNLDLHPKKLQTNGKLALIMYQGRVRREWFDALKRNEGFNIEIIQEVLLRACADEISNKIFDRKMEQVSTGPRILHRKHTLIHALPPHRCSFSLPTNTDTAIATRCPRRFFLLHPPRYTLSPAPCHTTTRCRHCCHRHLPCCPVPALHRRPF